METTVILIIAAGIAGIAFGYFLRIFIALKKKNSIELDIKTLMLDAKEQEARLLEEATKKSDDLLREARAEIKEKDEKLKRTEERLIKKEELLDKRQTDIDNEVEDIKERIEKIKELRQRADDLIAERTKELERVAKFSLDEAKKELETIAEKEAEEDLMVRLQKLETFGAEQLERKAKDILTTVIHRLANSVSPDIMTTSVVIPNDEIKGKIIGKEGRNIKAFERATGVEVIVDDTPGAITLSCFDPVRRQVARLALENLVLDGRIQPAKIEETVEKSKQEINKIIKEKGEAAVFEAGVYNLDPRLVSILGRLYFRTSYGQNVLQHSVEMSHLAGMLAEELGANIAVAKAGALLHDIGKALDHEVAGTHVEIGRRILQKFNVSEDIIKAMQAHHGEYPFETPESIIVQVADAISGGRPGARRDTVENYLKRLADLEATANSFAGVEKSYALQAGREIRVFVTPDAVSDLEARKMARDIALRIESELKYPGEIKVSVIRETRVIEFAR
ncbi:MAG TPA: ribonuclease Y [Candidatus Paceibacterota bacterium]|jgi:ribonuclease Y|nr:ribonuclease Y [Candidatus Paceibacterota bacterium]